MEERSHNYFLMEFYISNTLAYASPQQAEMLRKGLWTKAAHTDLKVDSGWFEWMVREKLILTNVPHLIVADVSSPDPTTCGFATKSSPPMALMNRILQRLEKTDMPRAHGRFKDLHNVKYPRSILLGLYTKRRVGIARHTASHVDLMNDIHELARHRPSLMDYTAITLIKSCEGESVRPHCDRFNLGESSVISIGNFSGGQLWTESKNGTTPAPSTPVDTKGTLTVTRHSWTILDAANVLHAVMPVTKGTRYSIAIYSPKHLHALEDADWSIVDHLWLPSDPLEVDLLDKQPGNIEFDCASPSG
eukprot:2965545-Amphidinium_carterae.3